MGSGAPPRLPAWGCSLWRAPLLQEGASRWRGARAERPAMGFPRPGPGRFSAAASGCLCFAASRERQRRPRQEAPGHRRLRRPPSPPPPRSPSPSRPPPSLTPSLSPPPLALPALRPAPRLLRPAPCGAAAAGGSSCPQMWAGRCAGNFRAGCECGPPAAARLPWIRRLEPPAACSAPRCCSCSRRSCRRRPPPGSQPPPTPQVGAARSCPATPGADPALRARMPRRPLPWRRPLGLG